MQGPTTIAWIATFNKRDGTAKECTIYQPQIFVSLIKLRGLIARMHGRLSAYETVIAQDQVLTNTVNSDFLRGQIIGEKLTAELVREWMQQELRELQEIEKDLSRSRGL